MNCKHDLLKRSFFILCYPRDFSSTLLCFSDLSFEFSLSLVPPVNRTCPQHYVLVGDDCYFVSYSKLSWKEAREVCLRENGGDLASVHSSFEQGKNKHTAGGY